MKKLLSAFFTFILIASFTSLAQAENSVRIDVSHEFSIGKVTLPAGSYTVKRVSPESNSVLSMRSFDGKLGTLILPITAESNDAGTAQVEFSQTGSGYRVTGINTPAGVYKLAVVH